SVLDRPFGQAWDTEMSPHWRRQSRRRRGLPNYRLVRYADDFVVLVHGTRSDAKTLRATIGELLASKLGMTLSVEKTHITHLDDGFDFLGFRIQRRTGRDGRRVVLTIPAKHALAAVMHKIKTATGRGTTSLSLAQVLRKINPILRGWAAYFRYGASKKTFSYLGWYAWWRVLGWIRRKHPRWTWKQLRRRHYGVDRITAEGLTLYNPAKMRRALPLPRSADRHALQHRRGQLRRSEIPPDQPRRCCLRRPGLRTRHLTHRHEHVESRMRGNVHVRFGGRRREDRQPKGLHGVSSPTQHLPLPGDGASALFQVINQRYLKSSTILTTNVGIADWAGAFGDATVAAAMLDRLLHRATVVGIDGPSYRLRAHQQTSNTLRAAAGHRGASGGGHRGASGGGHAG
ncbi:MAG: RNA-directed polymerase, partial [Microbacteriaceae bacterium]|nr:RNA-directed polymerase [Microbacteriaceae bacterium]